MWNRRALVWAAAAVFVPGSVWGQSGPSPWASCSGCSSALPGSTVPAVPCSPCAVPNAVSMTWEPSAVMPLEPRVVTAFENVIRTEIRREPYRVLVPVTTHKQVTVDEGRYQMVWVPKPVTKTIAETAYRQEIRYRDVPYHVVQRVPTGAAYTPRSAASHLPAYRTAYSADPCDAAATSLPSSDPIPAATPAVPSPKRAPPQEAPAAPVPSPYGDQETVPSNGAKDGAAAKSSDGSEWITIRQRSAAGEPVIQKQSFEWHAQIAEQPRRRFGPIPSAAAVWQSQLRR